MTDPQEVVLPVCRSLPVSPDRLRPFHAGNKPNEHPLTGGFLPSVGQETIGFHSKTRRLCGLSDAASIASVGNANLSPLSKKKKTSSMYVLIVF